jgi:gamma-glutamyltranspeptidase/glutathione hydrolase
MVRTTLGGAVVCEYKLASEIGTRILAAGGNAVDAAIATVIAVNVTCPYHSDLGGGGFAIIRSPAGHFEALNFRSCAPAKATPEFYQDASVQFGGTAVAVPGQMSGLEKLHTKYGRLKWDELFEECIDLAENGQEMREDLRHYITEQLEGKTNRKGSYMEGAGYSPFFDEAGEVIELGQKVKRTAYARALRLIAEQGAKVCYEGEIAEGIVRAVQADGGLMTMDDIKGESSHPSSWMMLTGRLPRRLGASHHGQVQGQHTVDGARTRIWCNLAQYDGHLGSI